MFQCEKDLQEIQKQWLVNETYKPKIWQGCAWRHAIMAHVTCYQYNFWEGEE